MYLREYKMMNYAVKLQKKKHKAQKNEKEKRKRDGKEREKGTEKKGKKSIKNRTKVFFIVNKLKMLYMSTES